MVSWFWSEILKILVVILSATIYVSESIQRNRPLPLSSSPTIIHTPRVSNVSTQAK